MPNRITFVGHSTVAIELDGTRLITDPVLRPRFLHIPRLGKPVDPNVASGVDAVLISHLHFDHLDVRSLRRLGPDVEAIVPAGGERLVAKGGLRTVRGVVPGDSITVGALEVTATPAVHNGKRIPLSRHVAASAIGYDIRGPSARIYFAGDTDLFDGMRDLRGGVDIALLPVAGWGARVGRGHLDPERAAAAAQMIEPRMVIPIHWGTFMRPPLAARRPELMSEPPSELARRLAELAPGIEVRILEPGASLDLRPS